MVGRSLLCSQEQTSEQYKLMKSTPGAISIPRNLVTLSAAAGRLLEHDKQWDDEERRDHQQLEIVDVGNDLRLLRDHGVKCRAPAGSRWIPELCDSWGFEHAVHSGDVLNDIGVVGLRVLCQQAGHH